MGNFLLRFISRLTTKKENWKEKKEKNLRDGLEGVGGIFQPQSKSAENFIKNAVRASSWGGDTSGESIGYPPSTVPSIQSPSTSCNTNNSTSATSLARRSGLEPTGQHSSPKTAQWARLIDYRWRRRQFSSSRPSPSLVVQGKHFPMTSVTRSKHKNQIRSNWPLAGDILPGHELSTLFYSFLN